MERWNSEKQENVENTRIDTFLAEVIEVCRKHGLSISHEDRHGGFLVEDYDEYNSKWLLGASDHTAGNA